jgi:hypothetical protein
LISGKGTGFSGGDEIFFPGHAQFDRDGLSRPPAGAGKIGFLAKKKIRSTKRMLKKMDSFAGGIDSLV